MTASHTPAALDHAQTLSEKAEVPRDIPPDVFGWTLPSNENLRSRAVRGGVVTLGAQGVKFVLRTGSTAALARLLVPADFGLVAMVTVITGFVEIFKDAGLSMATIQRSTITQSQVSTLFWINIAISILIAGLIAVLAPEIAWFYSEPKLLSVTLVLAGIMALGGIPVQHIALLRRQMRFISIAVVEVVSMLAGLAAAVVLASFKFGYWSLVAMTGVSALSTAVLAWLMSGWSPNRPSKADGLRGMLAFGGYYSACSFISYAGRNGDNFLVGRVLGPGALGIYSRAFALLLAPFQQLLSPISQVVEPVLCRLIEKPAEFRRAYSAALELSATLTLPIITVLTLAAQPAVYLLLGPKWLAVVPVFQCLALAAMVYGVRTAHWWLFVSSGRMDRALRWTIIWTAVVFGGFAITVHHGERSVAISLSVTESLLFIPAVLYASRGTPVSAASIFRSLTVPIALAIAIAATFVLLRIVGLSSTVATVFASIVPGYLTVARVIKLKKYIRR